MGKVQNTEGGLKIYLGNCIGAYNQDIFILRKLADAHQGGKHVPMKKEKRISGILKLPKRIVSTSNSFLSVQFLNTEEQC